MLRIWNIKIYSKFRDKIARCNFMIITKFRVFSNIKNFL